MLFLLFLDTFEKYLEMGETSILLFVDTFENSLEMVETLFLLFLGPFLSRNRRKWKVFRNNIFPYELSAEGAKRGKICLHLPDWSPPNDAFWCKKIV